MITMRDEVSAMVSATRSHAVRTIIELPFVRVAVRLSYSEADKGMSTEIRILYGAGQVKRFPVTTRATARAGRPRWLATHRRHKPTQIAVIAGRHKPSRPRRVRFSYTRPARSRSTENRSIEKTRHPRKGDGLDLLGLRPTS